MNTPDNEHLKKKKHAAWLKESVEELIFCSGIYQCCK